MLRRGDRKWLGDRFQALEQRMQTQESAMRRLAKQHKSIKQREQRMDLTLRRVAERLDRSTTSVEPGFSDIAQATLAAGRTLMGPDRLYVLWQAVRNTAHLGLPALEVGTFRGGSARFIAASRREFSEPAALYVYDTFEGHLGRSISEWDPHHRPGLFSDTSLEEVVDYLAELPEIEVRRGAFPEAAATLPGGVRFGFAHLDVDLYVPTLRTLELLVDRMPPGAVIVVDDYGAGKTAGVMKAIREALDAGLPYQLWDSATEQAVLIRR